MYKRSDTCGFKYISRMVDRCLDTTILSIILFVVSKFYLKSVHSIVSSVLTDFADWNSWIDTVYI